MVFERYKVELFLNAWFKTQHGNPDNQIQCLHIIEDSHSEGLKSNEFADFSGFLE